MGAYDSTFWLVFTAWYLLLAIAQVCKVVDVADYRPRGAMLLLFGLTWPVWLVGALVVIAKKRLCGEPKE